VLTGALSSALCTVAAIHPAGDHDIVVGHVRAARIARAGSPLAYHSGRFARLHRL
jgi:3-hydroxy-9,10-secoandrosta-1,3,5(10)-triene-9,17-dione monooxygenase reductase component